MTQSKPAVGAGKDAGEAFLPFPGAGMHGRIGDEAIAAEDIAGQIGQGAALAPERIQRAS